MSRVVTSHYSWTDYSLQQALMSATKHDTMYLLNLSSYVLSFCCRQQIEANRSCRSIGKLLKILMTFGFNPASSQISLLRWWPKGERKLNEKARMGKLNNNLLFQSFLRDPRSTVNFIIKVFDMELQFSRSHWRRRDMTIRPYDLQLDWIYQLKSINHYSLWQLTIHLRENGRKVRKWQSQPSFTISPASLPLPSDHRNRTEASYSGGTGLGTRSTGGCWGLRFCIGSSLRTFGGVRMSVVPSASNKVFLSWKIKLKKNWYDSTAWHDSNLKFRVITCPTNEHKLTEVSSKSTKGHGFVFVHRQKTLKASKNTSLISFGNVIRLKIECRSQFLV